MVEEHDTMEEWKAYYANDMIAIIDGATMCNASMNSSSNQMYVLLFLVSTKERNSDQRLCQWVR
jgi:hypothetical protein